MKVSVITVSFNSAKTIEDTLLSVTQQNYSNIEFIVIDGGSTDGTQEICARYKDKITTFISEKDKGIYDAMNKGIALATGDVIGILNSDDVYYDNNVITDVVKTLDDSKAEALYADLIYVDRDNMNKVTRYWHSGKFKHGKFKWGWMPPHPTVFLKRELYTRYGVFNLELRSAADYELMLRFFYKHKVKPTYLNRVITKMRVGGESNASLKNRVNANKEDRKAWEINGLKPNLLTIKLKPVRKINQFIFKRVKR